MLEIRISCWWQSHLMWLCFSHIYWLHTVTLAFHGKEPENLCEDSTWTIYLSNTNTTQMGPKSRKKTGRTKEAELSWEFMEWNTFERAIKRETDTKTKKEVGKLSWFIIIYMSKRYITKTIVFKCNCYVRKLQNVPKYGGGGGGDSIMRVIIWKEEYNLWLLK